MNIAVSGYGKMGQLLCQTIEASNDTLIGAVDALGNTPYETFSELPQVPDVIIDFSHPSQLMGLLEYAMSNQVSIVLGTTNYSDVERDHIKQAAKQVSILHTSNTSLGVQVLLELVKQAQALLPEADIEIVETHHRHKVDAPSGTANMVVDVLQQQTVYGRSGVQPRQPGEIGVHSVRGGTVAGKHEVSFYLDDEVITITHQAERTQVFVNGAIKAAQFIVQQPSGYYTMNDVVKELL